MAKQYGFARISDTRIVELLNAVAALHPGGRATFNVIDNVSVSVASASTLPEDWSSILTDHSYLISTGNAQVPEAGLTLNYYRGQVYASENGTFAWRPAANPYLDGIEIQGPTQNAADYGPRLLELIRRFLEMAPPLETAEIASSSVQKSEMILDRMSGAVASLTEQAGAAYARIEERRAELEREAKRDLAVKKAELDGAADVLRSDLEQQRKVLEDKLAHIDANDNTHSRRSIAANMRAFAKDTLEATLLSRSNRALLMPVLGSLVGMLASGVLTYRSASALAESLGRPAASAAAPIGVYYFMEARTLALGALTATLLWFALRQLTARYQQVAKWESDLNRFRLDTERASFLVEADLEARKLNGEPLAQVVLESFSRGLFGAGADVENGTEPVGTALNTILNRPASLKVSGNGVEVTVDKAGLKKAGKEIEKQD